MGGPLFVKGGVILHYLSVFDHNTGKRVAFLQNAYGIGYTLERNALWTARFTMPVSDPKNQFCKYFNFVEIYDGEKYIGLFRILPATTTKNESTREIVYECEHVLATLMDDILLGWHEIGNRGVYTASVLRYILDQQTVPRWQLGRCEFSYQYLYGWENENLLSALFSVPQPFTEDYIWDFDTTSTPWVLSLKKAPTAVNAEIRYRKNMRGVVKTEDPTNLCTRLYPLGYGEGANQLTIASKNGGVKYLDADTIPEYGIISKIWVDQRYQDPQSLYDAARSMLEELKRPAVSYSVEVLHNKELQKCSVGDRVRVVDDELGIDFYTRVTAIDKSDVVGAPNEANVTLANKARDIASSLADLSDRQRISETYSQGAVTLFTTHFYDNCSPDCPAELRFYIPENVVHVNQILLNGSAAAFRGYTKATQGGGASASTTGSGGGSYTSTASGGGSNTTSSSGGGSNTTSSSGGGSNVTSSSGGGSVATSEGAVLTSSNTVHDPTDDGGAGGANHNHGLYRGAKLALTNDGKTVSGYVGFVPSGKHVHPAHSHRVNIAEHTHKVTIANHTHTVSIPAHTHSVQVPSHSHSVTISAHQHNFSIPNHTHDITYGIYTGTTAKRLTISVDGRAAGNFCGTVADLDLVRFLSKDGGGNITRGWHTIQITPDILSRVEFDLVIQLFANSRGGGQY